VKVGDLVMFTPGGVAHEAWDDWYGIVLRERKVVMWNRDNNVKTTNKKKDLTVINESR
jgi:hypothetical protein